MKPDFCCLSLTDKCMLKCRMCFSWKSVTREEHPSLKQYKNFISKLRELVDDKFAINFVGGEVLLFKGFLDLVKFSVEKGFLANTASNSWLIDEDMARRMGDSGLNEISLSLDSLNETTHDYLRGRKGAYRRVMDSIDFLNKYSPNTKIGICSAIYDWNLNELIPLLEWVNNNDKIRSIFFLAPKQPNYTEVEQEWWKGKYGYLWPNETEKACCFIDKLLKMKLTDKGSKIGNTFPQLETFKLYFQYPERFVKKAKCNLDKALFVNAMGDILLCFRSAVLGNIKNENNIKEIWYSDKANEVRKGIALCQKTCHFLLNLFFEGEYPFRLVNSSSGN